MAENASKNSGVISEGSHSLISVSKSASLVAGWSDDPLAVRRARLLVSQAADHTHTQPASQSAQPEFGNIFMADGKPPWSRESVFASYGKRRETERVRQTQVSFAGERT